MTHPRPTLREWLKEAPFTLALSSGFFGFYAHAGFVTALLDAGLTPCRAAGSSAGALVATSFAAGLAPDRVQQELFGLRKEHFWDPALGLGLLRGKLFHDRLVDLFGSRDLATLPTPVAVSVFELASLKTRVKSAGALAPAVCASCAVPGLFHPVRVDGRLCVDGGVRDRGGLAGLHSDERLLFHHLTRAPRYKAGETPKRSNAAVVVIDGLPRLGPDQLTRGPEAFEAARVAVKAALTRPHAPVHVEPA